MEITHCSPLTFSSPRPSANGKRAAKVGKTCIFMISIKRSNLYLQPEQAPPKMQDDVGFRD